MEFLTYKRFFGSATGYIPKSTKVKYIEAIFFLPLIIVLNIYSVEVNGKVIDKEDGKGMKIRCKLSFVSK